MNIPNVSQNPELKVTKCKIHKSLDIDSKLDKLCTSYAVRLAHKGCSKELCLNKYRNESILGKILKLRRTSTEIDFSSNIGSIKQQRIMYSSNCKSESDCLSISLSKVSSKMSYRPTSSSITSSCSDLAQDTYEMEQIRFLQFITLLNRQIMF